MYNRRWAIIVGLGIVELWIVGLMLRSLAGGGRVHVFADTARAPSLASPVRGNRGTVRTIVTGATPRIVVDDEDAILNIAVRPGASVDVQERVRHVGWSSRRELPVAIEKTADGVRITRGSSGFKMEIGGSQRLLDIVVPPQARLDVRNAGSTTAAGLRAGASFHSDDGSVAVSDQRGELRVTTEAGRIELSGVEAPFVETRSDDGGITFDRVRADRVAVTTDSGRIEIGRSLLHGGKIESDNGQVALELDPQSDVTISARVKSGNIIAALPLIVRGSGEDVDGPATIRVGSGSGQLNVGSGDGSVSVRTGGV